MSSLWAYYTPFINPIIVDYVGIVFTSEHTEREKCDTIESIGVDSEQKGAKVHSYGSIFKLTVKSRAVLIYIHVRLSYFY